MNIDFQNLCNLSKFDFSEKEQVRFIEDLNAIAAFVGKVTEFDAEYDDTAEMSRALRSADLREDTVISAATPEQLLANTKSDNNCYIIPRVVD
jgi:aspartyl/glutamyl-tRNA(Asn/Gln) amidotransferase C subunit